MLDYFSSTKFWINQGCKKNTKQLANQTDNSLHETLFWFVSQYQKYIHDRKRLNNEYLFQVYLQYSTTKQQYLNIENIIR